MEYQSESSELSGQIISSQTGSETRWSSRVLTELLESRGVRTTRQGGSKASAKVIDGDRQTGFGNERRLCLHDLPPPSTSCSLLLSPFRQDTSLDFHQLTAALSALFSCQPAVFPYSGQPCHSPRLSDKNASSLCTELSGPTFQESEILFSSKNQALCHPLALPLHPHCGPGL